MTEEYQVIPDVEVPQDQDYTIVEANKEAIDVIKKLIFYNLKHNLDTETQQHTYAIGFDNPAMVIIPHAELEDKKLTYGMVVNQLYEMVIKQHEA